MNIENANELNNHYSYLAEICLDVVVDSDRVLFYDSEGCIDRKNPVVLLIELLESYGFNVRMA